MNSSNNNNNNGAEYFGDLIEKYKIRESSQREDYDKLAEEYNKIQEKLEGAETHNSYLEQEIIGLKEIIKAFETVKTRPNPLVEPASKKVQQPARNPNRGFWIRFDLSNLELTRPLINIIMRSKERPKEFFIEALGDDVIEVSETKLS